MRANYMGMRLAGIGLLGVLAAPPVAKAADASCDRACLDGFVDQYMAALVAHDPARLPLTKTARYSENGVTLPWARACGAP